jgi:ABC-type lipoprotein export system ATPase subunit
MSLLSIEGLRKSYRAPDGSVQTVLSIERFAMEAGERMGLRGESGSGKTTLTVAGILRPTRARSVSGQTSDSSAKRNGTSSARSTGYAFQTSTCSVATALENVLLGMVFGTASTAGRASPRATGARRATAPSAGQLRSGSSSVALAARSA